MKIGFDSDKYKLLQSQKIEERIEYFGGKLYLEFGGKLLDDFHASRVLPGFLPDSKIQMLAHLKDSAEIVVVVSAKDITANKLRSDLGITYQEDVLRIIDLVQGYGLYVSGVVISHFQPDNEQVQHYIKRLTKLGMPVYKHYYIKGYPTDVEKIVSEEGYGKNDYIKTTRPLVVVTAPGPGSGKMATCLSQLYHDYKKGIKAGYAKFETFPIWNLPLNHLVNVAYEAATADLKDVNIIDPWHYQAYGKTAINYNRDVEIFPVLNHLFKQLMGGESPYKSPTDMGVNMVGFCISDDQACQEAARHEIVRRYYKAVVAQRRGADNEGELEKINLIMHNFSIDKHDLPVARVANQYREKNGVSAAAIELADGTIVTGKKSDLIGCASAVLLNALKTLAGVNDSVKLIPHSSFEPIQNLKTQYLGSFNPRLHTDECLIALSITALTDPVAQKVIQQLPKLKGCQVHTTDILSPVDEKVFRKLGMYLTSEPTYSTKKLFHN
ncbi:MAG: DUF1846 domain-containing protein [Clostridia bacterium]|nr:DUF1846 domain-containing protein [Clostridia bacterium]